MGALDAGYVRRGNDKLPRQGAGGPWRVTNNFLSDARMLRRAPLEDGILDLRRTSRTAERRPARNVLSPGRGHTPRRSRLRLFCLKNASSRMLGPSDSYGVAPPPPPNSVTGAAPED